MHHQATHGLTYLLLSVTLLVTRTADGQESKPATSAWSVAAGSQSPVKRLIVMTIVDDLNSDSFIRFNRSVEAFELKLELVRLGSEGRDELERKRARFEALRGALVALKNEPDLVIMLLNGRDSIVNGGEQEILRQFHEFHRTNGTRLLFAADKVCWPDEGLAEKYPFPEEREAPISQKRFLNSGALIGEASALWDLLAGSGAANLLKDGGPPLMERMNYDFQRYCSHLFVDRQQRERLNMELDHRSSLFESLSAVSASSSAPFGGGELELDFAESADRVGLKNLAHNTRPLVVLGSGSNKVIELNSLGNYLGKAWSSQGGCRHCNSTTISLASIKDSDLPRVLIGVFIEEPTPFMGSFFSSLSGLNYSKSQLHLFIHNEVEYHAQHVAQFLEKFGPSYASHELVDRKSGQLNEAQARDYALLKCKQIGCDYYLALDSLARLEEPNSLRHLIESNRTIVAPLLSRPGKLWSNFWGSMTHDGYYERSHDYVDLVTRRRTGIWNVPLIMNAYLIEGKFLRGSLAGGSLAPAESELTEAAKREGRRPLGLTYFDAKFGTVKPALIFSRQLRAANLFQHVDNTIDFGHLIDPTGYNTSRLHPDLYELIANKHDWEREYLHENFSDLFDERDEDEKNYPDRIRLEQPCQDVYWFPVVSERFCDQLIELMEQFGQWSSGTNSDPRIEGGYESVPTRDIHFKQVGLHELWLHFLREYIMPIQLKEYIGYEHDPPRTELAFVVRYHPSEQASLRPHHDSSTYTLNVALNTPGVDYEGGGCRFVRYNCSVTESRKGWALIHPGRLTHYHEGLPVTKGTRYILVTFVDP